MGAPFYFDRTKEEGGAVYIYLNENGSFKNKYDIALRGPEKSGFGMSVSAIGDINQDGFQGKMNTPDYMRVCQTNYTV